MNEIMENNVLVYAFTPWSKNLSNISEEVLERLDVPVTKIILRVGFNKQAFLDLLHKDCDYIVGLGQYPRGKLIRIEQVAHNIYGSKNVKYTKIDDGPVALKTDLILTPTTNSVLTSDAGKYICNYSMYCIIRAKRRDQKFAFLHIPKGMNLNTAVIGVQEILRQVV